MGKMFEQLKEWSNTERAKLEDEKKSEKDRIKQMDKEGIPYCPKCKSASVQYLDRRKKLSLGRAVVGGALLSVPGAMVGAVTSKKHNGKMKCLKCGNEWKL